MRWQDPLCRTQGRPDLWVRHTVGNPSAILAMIVHHLVEQTEYLLAGNVTLVERVGTIAEIVICHENPILMIVVRAGELTVSAQDSIDLEPTPRVLEPPADSRPPPKCGEKLIWKSSLRDGPYTLC